MKRLMLAGIALLILGVAPPFTGTAGTGDDLAAIDRAVSAGMFDEARDRLAAFRRSHPDEPRALLVQARLEDDLARAAALLREVERLAMSAGASAPDSSLAADAGYERAELRYAAGNAAEARALHEAVMTRFPQTAAAVRSQYRLGILALEDGDAGEAAELFRACLARDDAGYIRLAASVGVMECHVLREEWEQVIDAAREVLRESDPDSAYTPRVLEAIALAWRKLGSGENAAWYTDRLLATYPESYQAHAVRERGRKAASNIDYEDIANHPGDAASGTVADRADRAGVNGSAVAGRGGSPVSGGGSGVSRPADDAPVFSVQASAFVNRMNAYKMYTDLKRRGFDVRIEMKTVGSKHFYKVLVGRFQTRGEADRMVKSVSAATGIDANVMIVD